MIEFILKVSPKLKKLSHNCGKNDRKRRKPNIIVKLTKFHLFNVSILHSETEWVDFLLLPFWRFSLMNE
jgi:hypothetical protein